MDFKKRNIIEVEVDHKIDEILKAEIPSDNKLNALKTILSVIDLTTLEGSDNIAKIDQLCKQAKEYESKGPQIPNVAAVCVYPPFVKHAKKLLKDKNISIASVAGAFPSGQSPIYIKIAEINYAVEEGADEIDMVISRGAFLEGNFQRVYEEIKAIKKSCGKAHLKVILETGELGSLSNIRLASDIAIQAGADFIKTSTGKIQPAATLQAFYVMLHAIKDYYKTTGKMVGIKPAGGISEPDEALKYYSLLFHVLGEKWMNKTWFRIGASRLANKVLDKILEY